MPTPRTFFRLSLALAGLLLLAGAALAVPPQYLIVDSGVIAPTDASQGFRVSMTGIATGRSFGNPTRAFTWTNSGGLVALPNLVTPARNYSVGNGVNDLGDVVGNGTTTSFGSSPLPLFWHLGAVSQLALPALEASGGSIIFIGSVHTRLALAGRLAYAASKGAVQTMSRTIS